MTKEKVSTKSGLLILGQQIPQSLLGMSAVLMHLSPSLQASFLLAGAMIQTWGAFGQARINELVEYINLHKDEFNPTILETDEFKSIFLNVVEAHMKETMSDKRQLYRNYLLNVGKGVHTDFDYHSKLLTILNLITFEEIHTLEDLKLAHNSINASYQKLNPGQVAQPTAEDLGNVIESIGSDTDALAGLVVNMRLLETYGLILTGDASYSGTGAKAIRLETLTNFGEIFLDFIK